MQMIGRIPVLAVLCALVLGAVAGAGGMLVAFPYLFPPAPLGESVVVVDEQTLERTLGGTFRTDSTGQDKLHWGRGTVELFVSSSGYSLLQLGEDFEVGPGPNFWIYLSSTPGIEQESDFIADEARTRLAKLKSFTGAQVYPVERDLALYARSITIWCETFGQYIASADLSP